MKDLKIGTLKKTTTIILNMKPIAMRSSVYDIRSYTITLPDQEQDGKETCAMNL